MKRKSLSGASCVSLMMFSIASPAMAERSSPLTIRITEVERMNWGTIAIPASGTQYVELSPVNQTVKGTGTVLFGMPRRGVYKLSSAGDECAAVTIDIANVSTGSANLKLDHFQGVYSSIHIKDFPSPTLPTPTKDSGGTLLYLGARATVGSAMAANNLLPTFDINVIVN